MKDILKVELKKSVMNKGFLIAVLIGCFLAVLSFIYNVTINIKDINATAEYIESEGITYNPEIQSSVLFNNWIGGEGASLGTAVYYFLLPLLITLPYGWSFAAEKKSGYRMMLAVHCGRRKYFVSKYIAVFISGGLAIVIPLIFSIMLTACYFPAVKPFVLHEIYYSITSNDLFADLYYTYPFIYLLLYMVIDFVFCGVLACLCITASLFIKQKAIVMAIPMVLCMAADFCIKFVYDANEWSYNNKELSPMYYLKPYTARYPSDLTIILLTFAVLFVITFVISYGSERNNEIY